MYIPIGPSKKQLYKIIIALLLLCYLIFFGISKPKANTIGNITTRLNINGSGINIDTNSNISVNQQSIVTGSLLSYPMGNGIDMLNGVGLIDSTNNNVYMCDVGTSLLYNDSTSQIILMSFECNVPKQSGPYAYRIGYSKGSQGVITGITTSGYVNIVPVSDTGGGGGSGIDYTNNFSDLYYTLQDIKNRDNTFYHDIYVLIEDKLNAILTALTSNSTTITNIQQNTQQINDALNDSSIDNSSANDLTNNSAFQDSNGLDNIIKAPLNFIQSLTSTTCSPINLTIPFMNADVSLPCMSSIYTKALGIQLVNTISLVINGVVLYRYCLKILQLVHNAKNPNKDELEVLDL